VITTVVSRTVSLDHFPVMRPMGTGAAEAESAGGAGPAAGSQGWQRLNLRKDAPAPRPSMSDELSLARPIAYVQLIGAGLALSWTILPSISGVNRTGMFITALIGSVFGAVLLRASVPTRWSGPVALTGSVVLSGYIYFGGESASPFGLLYLLAAILTAWSLSDIKAVMAIGWLVGIYVAVLWLSHSPGEPAWPGLSPEDSGVLLIGVGALCATTLLARGLKRLLLERDQRYGTMEASLAEAVYAFDCAGVITRWNAGATQLYGYTASEAIGQPVGVICPLTHRDAEQEVLSRMLAGEHMESHETEQWRKDGIAVAVCISFTPICDGHNRVLGAWAVARDVSKERHAKETILHQALHDSLTGLPNRALVLEIIQRELSDSDLPLAVLSITIDGLELINDSFGHEAGDELVRAAASRLASAVPAVNTIAHLSGGEFVVLHQQASAGVNQTTIAYQLMAAMRHPFELEEHQHVLSTSIGVAMSTPDSSAGALLRDAHAAMHRAKESGGGRCELFDQEMRSRVLSRFRIEADLRHALAGGEQIHAHYQPLVSLTSGEIVGAEAVARWRHPEWGAVSPEEFIPVAEATGLILGLGEQIMRLATRQCRVWQASRKFTEIAVNVSARQLVNREHMEALVRQATAASGLSPRFLTLEITESALIDHLDAARSTVEWLNDLGIGLSLDDFGTGYSSLSYIRNLPFDRIKIDRSLIADIVGSPQAAALVRAVIEMGHALDQSVVAEGIETLPQVTCLRELGCDIAQGFYFSAPLAPEEFTTLLENQPEWLPPSTRSRVPRAPRPRSTRTPRGSPHPRPGQP